MTCHRRLVRKIAICSGGAVVELAQQLRASIKDKDVPGSDDGTTSGDAEVAAIGTGESQHDHALVPQGQLSK